MEERNFWLILSVIIIALSGILILVVGYIYFVVVPRPMISTTTSIVIPTSTALVSETWSVAGIMTSTPSAAATQPQDGNPTNTPFRLDIITASPSVTIAPSITSPPPPTQTEQPPPDNPTPLPNYGSPGDFMRTYYDLINQREYNTTFAMLSNNFKKRFHCCNPDGSYQIEPYIDWWNKIDEVEVYSVKTTPRNGSTAQVTVRLIYHRADGSVVENAHTYDLIFDPARDSWLID